MHMSLLSLRQRLTLAGVPARLSLVGEVTNLGSAPAPIFSTKSASA